MKGRFSQNKILVLILIIVLFLAVVLPPLAIADRDGNPEKGNDNPPAALVAESSSHSDTSSSNQGQVNVQEKGRPDNGNPGQNQEEPKGQKAEAPPGLVENPGQQQGEGHPNGNEGNPNSGEGNPGVGQKPEPLPEPQGAPPQQNPGQGNGQPNIHKPDPPRRHSPPSSPGSQGKGRDKPHRGQPKGNEGTPKGNEGVGQTPDHSQKQSAAKIQILKDVLGTYTYDEAKKEYVRYKPEEQQRTGGGGGKRWMAVPQGGFIKYVIEVRNNGEAPVSDLVVWDMIPPHTSFHSADPDAAPDKRVSWGPFSLEAGASRFFYLTLKVNPSAPINHVITNVAKTNYGPAAECQVRVVGARPSPPGPSPGPAGPPDAPGPQGPPGPPGPAAYGVDFIKAVAQAFAQPSSILDYTIYVENTGGQEFLNIEIRDDIPANTTYVSGSATGGPTLTGNTLVWRIPSLKPGGSRQFKFQVVVNADAKGVIRNVAFFTSQQPQTKRERAVETTVIMIPPVVISPAGIIQPTPPVLILPAKVAAAALPFTGSDFLILYLIIALVFMVAGLAAQRLKT